MLAERTRSGTFGEQANWRVTVEGESSLNKLARVFPSQNTTVQEVEATSSDVAEPSYRLHRDLQDSEGVCVRWSRMASARSRTRSRCFDCENTATESYSRVHTLAAEFLVYSMCVEKPLMTYIGDDEIQIWKIHANRYGRSDRTERRHGVHGPSQLRQIGCVEIWCVQCQRSNETAAITLHDTDDTMRRAKTIPRNTTRHSNDSLGHCEEVEKQIRVFISHTWGADHNCDSDRCAAWTSAQRTDNAEKQTSFFKWTSKDDRGEVGKFAEWSWFRSVAQTSKLEEQRTEAHVAGKKNRVNEHLLVIKGLTRSAGVKTCAEHSC